MRQPLLASVFGLLLATACGGSDGTGIGDAPDGSAPNGSDGGGPGPGGGNDGSVPIADGSTGGGHDTPDGGASPDSATPEEAGPPAKKIKTVFVIVMENHNWSSITG